MDPLTDPDTKRVLQAVLERATDGYHVMTRTGIDATGLSKVLTELQSKGAVSVKGDLSPDRVGECYISVPPSSLGIVNFLLGRVSVSSMFMR